MKIKYSILTEGEFVGVTDSTDIVFILVLSFNGGIMYSKSLKDENVRNNEIDNVR